MTTGTTTTGPGGNPGTTKTTGAGTALIGRTSVTGTGARISLSCRGASTVACKIKLTLSVLETVRSGNVVAVAASKRVKTTKRTVTLASTTVTLTGGKAKTVTLTLNAAGKALLRKRHRLPARLTISESSSAGRTLTVARRTLTLTLKAPKTAAKRV